MLFKMFFCFDLKYCRLNLSFTSQRSASLLILVSILMVVQEGMTVPGSKGLLVLHPQALNISQFSRQVMTESRGKVSGNHFLTRREASASPEAAGGGQGGGDVDQKKFTGLYTGPYFDPHLVSNISAQLGDSALLACNVNQIGGKTVSWIRQRDSHILTVDRMTFISDDRFQILNGEKKNAWTLRIRFLQLRDAGIYECQVSTEPKLSFFVNLNIVVPRITIVGNGDVHANRGGKVVLRCRISGTLQKPAYVFWYFGTQRILPGSSEDVKSSIRVLSPSELASTSNWDQNNDVTPTSPVYEATLSIENVTPEQSGNYTCGPSNTKSASVRLHIVDSEIRAAMYDGMSSGGSRLSNNFVISGFVTVAQFIKINLQR